MGVTGEPSNRASELDWEVELVHAEGSSRVVLVRARQGGRVLEAALGEGATAEEAEDRARQRLQRRLSEPPTQEPESTKAPPEAVANPLANQVASQVPQPAPKASPPSAKPTPGPIAPASPQLPSLPQEAAEPPADPEDWSSELARLDLQLQRLGWERAQEGTYLERVFGHPSRNRLTSYSDLLAYLQALEGLAVGQDPATAPAPLRRRELLRHCDQLLEQLQWDPSQGRHFLEQHFSLASRQQLSDAQLLQFNMLLESEWLARAAGTPSSERASLH